MNDNIVVDGNVCTVLNTSNVEGKDYLYLAKLDEENDITGDFFVYEKNVETGELKKVTDSEELKKVLLVITSNLM